MSNEKAIYEETLCEEWERIRKEKDQSWIKIKAEFDTYNHLRNEERKLDQQIKALKERAAAEQDDVPNHYDDQRPLNW